MWKLHPVIDYSSILRSFGPRRLASCLKEMVKIVTEALHNSNGSIRSAIKFRDTITGINAKGGVNSVQIPLRSVVIFNAKISSRIVDKLDLIPDHLSTFSPFSDPPIFITDFDEYKLDLDIVTGGFEDVKIRMNVKGSSTISLKKAIIPVEPQTIITPVHGIQFFDGHHVCIVARTSEWQQLGIGLSKMQGFIFMAVSTTDGEKDGVSVIVKARQDTTIKNILETMIVTKSYISMCDGYDLWVDVDTKTVHGRTYDKCLSILGRVSICASNHLKHLIPRVKHDRVLKEIYDERFPHDIMYSENISIDKVQVEGSDLDQLKGEIKDLQVRLKSLEGTVHLLVSSPKPIVEDVSPNPIPINIPIVEDVSPNPIPINIPIVEDVSPNPIPTHIPIPINIPIVEDVNRKITVNLPDPVPIQNIKIDEKVESLIQSPILLNNVPVQKPITRQPVQKSNLHFPLLSNRVSK